MKISIIGTGGVGGYFGGRLARAGYDVSFLARGPHADAIRKNGLTVNSILGSFHIDNVNVKGSIPELGETDLALICVKAWQVKDIRGPLKLILHEGSSIIPLQNGIQAVEELSEEINRKNIISGLCRIFSMIEAPGVITHPGVIPEIVFAEMNNQPSERTKAIKEMFDNAGIKSRISNDIEADLWKKLIGICTSALLAVTRTTYGELRELRETRIMMIELIEEIYKLACTIGINIEHDFVDKTVAFIDTFPYDATSSLTRDVWDGKPSEIYYQNGAVVRLAEKYKVEVPVNKFVYNSILPMENKARRIK